MASSTQKKTTTKKSSSRSGSRTAKGKQPQKRPIRREVGGVILLVLALCVLVSYCGVQAILIDLLAKLLKGLFGYGYWLAGPAMLLAGGILLLHPGPPVTLRTTCALLLPLLAGALFHTIFAGGDYALNGWGVLKNLWTAGLALKAGGAVSGLLAEAAVLAVSKVVSLLPLRLAAGGSAAGGPACDALRRSGDGTEPAGVRGGAGAYARRPHRSCGAAPAAGRAPEQARHRHSPGRRGAVRTAGGRVRPVYRLLPA